MEACVPCRVDGSELIFFTVVAAAISLICFDVIRRMAESLKHRWQGSHESFYALRTCRGEILHFLCAAIGFVFSTGLLLGSAGIVFERIQ